MHQQDFAVYFAQEFLQLAVIRLDPHQWKLKCAQALKVAQRYHLTSN